MGTPSAARDSGCHGSVRRSGSKRRGSCERGRQFCAGDQGESVMKWVTREDANVDRIACPWLIRRFIDPDAEFLYVPRDEVLETAQNEGAHSYDAPGATYTHRDGNCSFDVLVEEFGLTGDAALVRL